MAWTKPTLDDLTATLSEAEISAFSRSAGFGDVAAAQLAQTTAAVRGYVRAGGRRVASGEGLIPPSLLPFALDFAAFRLLKRFRIQTNEDRRKAYDTALDVFKKVAAGQMAVEPEDEAADAASTALPSFMPANPERRLD